MLAALRKASTRKPASPVQAEAQPPSNVPSASSPSASSVTVSGSAGKSRQSQQQKHEEGHDERYEHGREGSEGGQSDGAVSGQDTGGFEEDDNDASGSSPPPRLFRRLPKRRRVDDLLEASRIRTGGVTADNQSILTSSSSNDTNHAAALFYEESKSYASSSTPATSRSDDGEQPQQLRQLTEGAASLSLAEAEHDELLLLDEDEDEGARTEPLQLKSRLMPKDDKDSAAAAAGSGIGNLGPGRESAAAAAAAAAGGGGSSDTVEISMTAFSLACQDGRGAEFLKEHGINLDPREQQQQSMATPPSGTTSSSNQPALLDTPKAQPSHTRDDMIPRNDAAGLAQDAGFAETRVELLSLSDIDMLVRHIAQGTSFFGGAGVTAVAAGLGLYEQTHAHLQSRDPVYDYQDGADYPQQDEADATEEFAKLALWATLPGAIENWISAPTRPSRSHARGAAQHASALADMYDNLLEAEGEPDEENAYVGGENALPDEAPLSEEVGGGELHLGQAADADPDGYSYDTTTHDRPDAFEANDRERWVHREEEERYHKQQRVGIGRTSQDPASIAAYPASASAAYPFSSAAQSVVGGSNTKKRKIPSSHSTLRNDQAMASPKISKRDENPFHSFEEPRSAHNTRSPLGHATAAVQAPMPDPSSLVDLADEILGMPLGGNTVAAPPVLSPAPPGRGRQPRSSAAIANSQAFKRDADMLARLPDADTLAAYVSGPAIHRLTREGKRTAKSSYRHILYTWRRKQPGHCPPERPSAFTSLTDPRTLLPPPPPPTPTLAPTPAQPALPMTAKRAAKAKKAKAKQPPPPVRPALRAPILPLFFSSVAPVYDLQEEEEGLASGEDDCGRDLSAEESEGDPRYARPEPRFGRDIPYTGSQFTFDCSSGWFQADLRIYQTQKLHLLMLLKAKRREELLRRKLELEKEKERLTKALAADLRSRSKASGGRKPLPAQQQVPPARSGSAHGNAALSDGPPPLSAPPEVPLPQVPSPDASEAPPPPSLVNGKPPPKKGKKKRSAYANANNVHHRQNYVPSRLPASSGGAKRGDEEGQNGPPGGSLDLPLPHSNESDVFNFGPDDWMCTFCEYELWYGSKPQLINGIKKRKKLLKVRQKAQDRAKGTIEGTNKKKAVPPAAPAPSASAADLDSPPTRTDATGKQTSATLPGSTEQQNKAEAARPTRAPPSSPNSNAAKLRTAAAPGQSPRKASAKASRDAAATADAASLNSSGITSEHLLAYHCLSNKLPRPVYYWTDMRLPAPAPHTKDEDFFYQACSIKLGKEIYKRGILSNERLSLGNLASEPAVMAQDPAEDIASRVLQHLISGQELKWNMSHAISQQGLVVYRPGEKDFICSLKEASQVYRTASALLEEYCRLDGQPVPMWGIQIEDEDPETGELHPAPLSIVSVALGERIFDIECSPEPEDEAAAREQAAVKALEWLQETKNAKFTALIKANREGRARDFADTGNIDRFRGSQEEREMLAEAGVRMAQALAEVDADEDEHYTEARAQHERQEREDQLNDVD